MSTLSSIESTVNSFYLAFYGRPADPDGLKFWSTHLANNGGNLASITAVFANSEEAQVRFGSDTLGERISEIYGQLFNRAPDATGLAFWTNAVQQGHATLADVSIAILGGAQGSDDVLSTLRQQAADDFTAQVEASGTLYSGYASIEAARILVRAVTPTATADDLKAVVAAAVSFADTASKNPAVVDAIASGSTLLALFDTVRGTGDPVALAQALADTAKAAAGDPVTLEQLLRGGGMAQVLKVMPANATLKDVVKALAEGGLPAAVEVVYPTTPSTPSTPSANLKLAFHSVSQGEEDTHVDTVTNVKSAEVKFTYTGSDLKSSQHFQYSTDGVHWSQANMTVNTTTNTVSIAGVDLVGVVMPSLVNNGFSIQGYIPPANHTTTFLLQAVDANGRVLAGASQDLTYDGSAPVEALRFVGIDGSAPGDNTTDNDLASVTFDLEGGQGDGIVQWRIKGDDGWIPFNKNAFNNDGSFTIDVDMRDDDQTIELRVIDAAGNIGDEFEQFIDGPVDTVPSFSIIPSFAGLAIDSNVSGTLQLLDVQNNIVNPLKNTEGTSAAVVGRTVIAAQDAILTGVVQLTPTNGPALIDDSGIAITLGTIANDTVSGRAVWGFGGNDTISGSSEGDYLFGGDGNDTINGGMGKDYIMGGRGGDTIDLGADEEIDVVAYEVGDAPGPVFVDGGATAGIDKISAFNEGDVIRIGSQFGATPVMHTTYLTGGTSNDYAVVRGSLGGGTFTAGSAAGDDDDYMVQWIDTKGVNSVIVQNYVGFAPLVEVDAGSNEITFRQPVPTPYGHSTFSLAGGPGMVTIHASGDTVTGLDNADGYSVLSFNTGAPYTTTIDYTDSQDLESDGDTLVFSGNIVAAGLYRMSWTSDTFTTGDGYLEAGQQYFAGGRDGNVGHDGFALATTTALTANLYAADSAIYNEAYIGISGTDARVRSGGGNDVVADNGSKLTILYTELQAGSDDLIIGFDYGNDVIWFEGDLGLMIDRNRSGTISWADDAFSIDANDEAMGFRTSDMILLGSDASMTTTLATLSVFNVSNIALEDGLLILASGASGNGAALFYYMNLDGNGSIDAEELTTIATFTGGAPDVLDIVVMGTQLD